MPQNNPPFISQNKQTVTKLLAIIAFCAFGSAVGCEDALEDPDSLLTDSSEPDARFGVFVKSSIKNWSALWHMSQKGSIEFCIVNKAYFAEDDEEIMVTALQDKLEYAVDAWIDLLKKDPPDESFPAWKKSSITVRFGCSGDHYNVTLSHSGSMVGIGTSSANMNIHYKQISEKVLAHEFGHVLGLRDTYPEDWYQNQPDSMMKNLKWSEDDKFAIWALWKYLKTGEISCGPGYYEEKPGKCIPGSDPDEEEESSCTPLHQTCESNDECCKGLECKVRVIGQPPICSAKAKPTKTRITDDVGGAAGRER